MSIKGLDRSGPLLFFSTLSLVATIIAFIQRSTCGLWQCYYIFLASAIIFLAWGIGSAMS